MERQEQVPQREYTPPTQGGFVPMTEAKKTLCSTVTQAARDFVKTVAQQQGEKNG